MDDLDRMFRRLVSVIRAEFPSYLDQPFEVAELYQSIIPYRHHRRELGFETNQDYELTLTRLLAGARGYVRGDSRMQERLRQELSGSNPDSSVFRGFATTTVTLDPEAVRWIESPEAERGERRPTADRGTDRFAEEHLVGGRQRGRDDAPEPDAQTVIFRRGSPTSTAATTAPAAAPAAAPTAAAATAAAAAASPPPPQPQQPAPQSGGGSTTPMAASASGGTSPISVTTSGPTPSTSFIRSGPPSDAPRPVPNAGQGDGGARSAGSPPPMRPPAAPPPRPTAPAAATGAAAASAGAARASSSASPSTRQAMPTPQRGAQTVVATGSCHYCGGELPDGRRITFCPHCGQNLTIQHCPACSTELELGWKFCTTCGREMTQ